MATNNRDLLREAIADAKTVKETAIANAKAALTESFTPFLREKLSAKIQEMDGYNDEDMDETMYEEAEEGLDEISLDELLAELDEYAEEQPNRDMDGDGDIDADDVKMMKEAKEKEEEEEMSIEDMGEDDLKSFIEDVIKDMVAAGELEAGHEGMEDEEEILKADKIEDDEIDAVDTDAEEIDLEELLAEIEEEEGEVKPLNEFSFNISDAEAIVSMLVPVGVITAAALLNFRKEIKDWFKNNKKISDVELGKMIKTAKEEKSEENSQIKELKSELNEINLLNSKLLYTNKIFRNMSLTESQKIKILMAFDKAKTKGEAKLIYETLQENLKVSTTRSPIKESLSSASKSLGIASSKPIIENSAFSRMRELAGLQNQK
jgi:hypothetical protein